MWTLRDPAGIQASFNMSVEQYEPLVLGYRLALFFITLYAS